jgi:peptide alpha-N-acetyltransferase
MKGLKNPLSWHILSQVYFSEKNYAEAYKSEQRAFSCSTQNNSIMRSLSLLQLHMRDYEAFRNSRREILLSNFTALVNWISFIVAEYFCGSPDKTEEILNSYLKTMEKHMSNQELSETLLFKARILESQEKFLEMHELLQSKKVYFKDTPTWNEFAVRAAVGAGKFEDAGILFEELIGLNCENSKVLGYFYKIKKFENDSEKVQGLKELQKKFPKSVAIEREILNYLSEDLPETLSQYLAKRIRKGIPSIFNDIRSLLRDPVRKNVVSALIRDTVESLGNSSKFLYNQTGEGKLEQPHCLMWTLYLHSQVLDFEKNYTEALEVINRAITHTPTVPDFYLFRGRIFKHLKEVEKASESVEEARLLDLADRYLNNKSARYLLRANKIHQAEEVMALFSKEKPNELNVHDMQSMWYELELSEALHRTGDLEKAVSEYRWIEKHLIEMFEDQYDFHFYVYRKMNLNTYIDFMQFIDSLAQHPHLLRSGKGLLRIHFSNESLVPLSEASRLCKTLTKFHSKDQELQSSSFRIFLRREKFLLALKCLNKLKTLESPEKFEELRQEFLNKTQNVVFKDPVREVISRVLNS